MSLATIARYLPRPKPDPDTHQRWLTFLRNHRDLIAGMDFAPRAWYRRALANPNVSVTRGGKTTDYRAVPVSEQERERLLDEPGFPLLAYVFTGFAPRQFLRLDPS